MNENQNKFGANTDIMKNTYQEEYHLDLFKM